MSDLLYWLALNSIPDIGPVAVRKLLSACGSPENVFQMSIDDLMQIEGIGRSRASRIISYNRWDFVEKELRKAETANVRFLTLYDPDYPDGLRQIHAAPIVLYVKGGFEAADKYAISIVGSRSSSEYGMQIAEKMACTLSLSGLTVVSGMARGIDTASHKGALRAAGRTVAVLGSGIDVPYPYSNKELMRSIESSGAVVSEFPFGTGPNKENFPRRNRIISGLSLGVVVIEATLDSGSLITVGYALDQGKEVFAVPGNVTSVNSRGTNDLIKRGARLVESAEEVIEELGPLLKGILREDRKPPPEMNEEEQAVHSCLDTEPKHIDLITRGIQMTSGRALSVLLSLELKGLVRQSNGKYFSLQ
jgi:DNA processing protein